MNADDDIEHGQVSLGLGEVMRHSRGDLVTRAADKPGTWRFRAPDTREWVEVVPTHGTSPTHVWIRLPDTPYEVRWMFEVTRRYMARVVQENEYSPGNEV